MDPVVIEADEVVSSFASAGVVSEPEVDPVFT